MEKLKLFGLMTLSAVATTADAPQGRHQALGALLSLSKSILFMIALCGRPLHARPSTLCNRLLRTLTLLLETRIIIKISTHPCYSRHFKKNPKWPIQKTEFFNSANSQYFFQKFHGLVLGLVCGRSTNRLEDLVAL